MYLNIPTLEKISRFWWITIHETRTICEMRDGMIHMIGHAEPIPYHWDVLRNVEWLGPVESLVDWIALGDSVDNYEKEFYQSDYKSWQHLLRAELRVKYLSRGHVKPGILEGFGASKNEIILVVPDETFKVSMTVKDLVEVDGIKFVYKQKEFLTWEHFLVPGKSIVWQANNGHRYGASIEAGGRGDYSIVLDHNGDRLTCIYIENIIEVEGIHFR